MSLLSVVICRPGCAACCIAPSITTAMPAMPLGKPAGVPCAHLTDAGHCALFCAPSRPAFCAGLQASDEMCGATAADAMRYLSALEDATRP
jgi:hypothetical protein